MRRRRVPGAYGRRAGTTVVIAEVLHAVVIEQQQRAVIDTTSPRCCSSCLVEYYLHAKQSLSWVSNWWHHQRLYVMCLRATASRAGYKPNTHH